MAAPKENKFWKLRSKHGVDAIFTDPEVLLKACYEYFEETSKRKWYKTDALRGGNEAGKVINIPTETPFSLAGLCIFLGVNTVYFNQFEASKTYKNNEDFSKVVTHVREVIRTQQLEGAITGTFKDNIIARMLGLPDTSKLNIGGQKDNPLTHLISEPLSSKEIKKFNKEIEEKY